MQRVLLDQRDPESAALALLDPETRLTRWTLGSASAARRRGGLEEGGKAG